MKRFGFIILVLVMAAYLTGCGKKQQTLEEMQEPMSMEVLTTMPETKSQTPQVTPTLPQTPAKLEPLLPAGPYKPTAIEIQTALKNAGYYTGAVDGKIGPLTRKATEEFQKANGLQTDGKVGPKTWSVLSPHLNPPPLPETKKR